ncbi:MAG: glycosyltransferase family 4 protein [Candidatus Odinarchaeota archaeon]|nr:glycosyltransferase family 4 protein [Candidatus Odinarchaeota archaeon]
MGSGGERSRLERLALDLGIAVRVTFHGFVKDKERVIEFISRADVLVNPSLFGVLESCYWKLWLCKTT